MLVRVDILCDACHNTVAAGDMEEEVEEDGEIDPRAVVRKFKEGREIPSQCPACGSGRLNLMIRY